MAFDLDRVKALIALATEKNLSELTLEEKDHKIIIKPAQAASAVPLQPMATLPMSLATETIATAMTQTTAILPAAEPTSTYYKVTSPMVGTFYGAPSPESPPFVELGQSVSVGQTLCIIEAMKLMNELESDVSGIVKKIVISNGKPVEFGQVLMEIEVQ